MVGHFPEVPNITIAAFPAGVCGIALLGAAGSGYLLGIVMPQCVYIIALITLVTVNAGVFGIAHFSAVGLARLLPVSVSRGFRQDCAADYTGLRADAGRRCSGHVAAAGFRSRGGIGGICSRAKNRICRIEHLILYRRFQQRCIQSGIQCCFMGVIPKILAGTMQAAGHSFPFSSAASPMKVLPQPSQIYVVWPPVVQVGRTVCAA